MPESEQPREFDVVIAGGGMVGGALCCALAEAGFSVALIEVREPARSWPPDEVDIRVSALTRASQHILENLGVWDAILSRRASPYREMQVWDACGRGSIHFDASSIGEPDLGHIVENRVTQLALWERMERLDGVTIHVPDEISDIGADDGRFRTVRLKSGARLRAHLLVAAEGARSPVREMAGIHSSGWSYDQHAIVATVSPAVHHGDTARQRFMPDGPLAFLPIDDGRCSIVWSTTPDRADELMGMSDAAFCAELTRASDAVLGEVGSVGERGVFPLSLRNADTYIGPRLVLIGDAAHGIHPLAGQGVNLGFMDAAVLFDQLVAARDAGRPLGSRATLRRYERARKGASVAMLGAMDLFKRLFSNSRGPLVALRNLGLNLADASGPVKHGIVRRAMGLVGERPSLATRRGAAASAGSRRP